jgi:hypothetical protein
MAGSPPVVLLAGRRTAVGSWTRLNAMLQGGSSDCLFGIAAGVCLDLSGANRLSCRLCVWWLSEKDFWWH